MKRMSAPYEPPFLRPGATVVRVGHRDGPMMVVKSSRFEGTSEFCLVTWLEGKERREAEYRSEELAPPPEP